MDEIFSGENSHEMWDEINNAHTKSHLRMALYSMGCLLQEFEAQVDKRFAELDKQDPKPLGDGYLSVYGSFDKKIAEARAEGAADERERIIKLLGEEGNPYLMLKIWPNDAALLGKELRAALTVKP